MLAKQSCADRWRIFLLWVRASGILQLLHTVVSGVTLDIDGPSGYKGTEDARGRREELSSSGNSKFILCICDDQSSVSPWLVLELPRRHFWECLWECFWRCLLGEGKLTLSERAPFCGLRSENKKEKISWTIVVINLCFSVQTGSNQLPPASSAMPSFPTVNQNLKSVTPLCIASLQVFGQISEKLN